MYTTYNKSSNPMSRSPETDLTYVYSFRNTAVTYGPSSERTNRKQKTYKRRCTACIWKELEIEHKKRDYQRLQNTVTKRLRSNEQKVKHLSSGIIKELEKENSSLREKLHEVEEDRDRLRDALWDLDRNSTQREETTQSLIDNLHEEYGKALEYISELKNTIQRKTEDDEYLRWRMKDMEEKYDNMEKDVKCRDDNVKMLEMNLYQEQLESDRLRITCAKQAERIDFLQKSLDKTVAEKEYFKHELESVKNGLMFVEIKNKENEIARLQEKIHLSEEAHWTKDEECKKVEKENRNLLEKLKNFELHREAERQMKQSLEYSNSSRKSEGDFARLQNQLHKLEVEYNLLKQENRNLQMKLEPQAKKDTYMYHLEFTSEMKSMRQNEELCNQIKRLEDKLKAMDQEKADLALMHSTSDKQKEDKIRTTKEKLRKVEIEIESLKSRSKHEEITEVQLRNLKTENQTFREYITMLMKEKENTRAECEETHEENRRLQENLNHLLAENKNLQEENARSRKKILDELQQQPQTSLRNEAQQLEIRIAELMRENAQLQVNMSKLSKEKDDTVRRQIEVEQKLITEKQNMQEKLDSLHAEKRLFQQETVASASKKLSETDQQLKVMMTTVRQLEEKVNQLSRENSQLHMEITEVSKEKENALTRQIEVEQKLKAEKQNMQEKLDLLRAEKKLVQEETAASASKKLSETDQQLKVMTTKVRQLEGKVAQLSSENSQLHMDIAEVSKEKENALTRQVEVEQKLMAENQNMQEKLDLLRAEKRLLQEETAASASKKLSETDQQIKVMATKVRQLEGKVAQLSSENTQLHMDIAEVSKEKENALTRLSKVAGAKLTHGNAAITDLSDTNRPTKIAEKFSELYDNQWTDAFEELDNTYNNEEETIQVLLKILKEAYDFCESTETNYETRIGQAVFTLADVNSRETRQITGVDVGVQKSLSDLRLSLGNACCLIVEEMYLTRLPSILKKVDVSVSPKTKLYARQCASLCWRMRIRDPPVFVRFEFRQGTEFNTDILRRYTKTGGYLDFIVWPALYLHEKGPVLSKGVAQPKHAP